jgi:hypothetical protein
MTQINTNVPDSFDDMLDDSESIEENTTIDNDENDEGDEPDEGDELDEGDEPGEGDELDEGDESDEGDKPDEVNEVDQAADKVAKKKEKSKNRTERRFKGYADELKRQKSIIDQLTHEKSQGFQAQATPAAPLNQNQQLPGAVPQPLIVNGQIIAEPSETNYGTYAEYLAALTTYDTLIKQQVPANVNPAITQMNAAKVNPSAYTDVDKMTFRINAKAEMDKNEGFKNAYLANSVIIDSVGPEVDAHIVNSKHGVKILHKLALNPELALALKNQTGVQLAQSFASLERNVGGAKVSKNKKPKGQKRRSNGNRSVKVGVSSLLEMSNVDYEKEMNS